MKTLFIVSFGVLLLAQFLTGIFLSGVPRPYFDIIGIAVTAIFAIPCIVLGFALDKSKK